MSVFIGKLLVLQIYSKMGNTELYIIDPFKITTKTQIIFSLTTFCLYFIMHKVHF